MTRKPISESFFSRTAFGLERRSFCTGFMFAGPESFSFWSMLPGEPMRRSENATLLCSSCSNWFLPVSRASSSVPLGTWNSFSRTSITASLASSHAESIFSLSAKALLILASSSDNESAFTRAFAVSIVNCFRSSEFSSFVDASSEKIFSDFLRSSSALFEEALDEDLSPTISDMTTASSLCFCSALRPSCEICSFISEFCERRVELSSFSLSHRFEASCNSAWSFPCSFLAAISACSKAAELSS
mmetsp:Transcript_11138/g.46492  ORF Transcript_11138/g.46492 Transcript_11138/m.46492 type:complete len:245 (+) Transcript_11138:1323-2057(+)